MKVLIITQWYPPEPGYLMQELAQSLQQNGHEVSILTGYPNYPTGKLYPGYKIRIRMNETIAGVPITRVPLYPEHSKSGIKRMLNYFSFAFSASFLGVLFVKKPEILFVYHPPLTVGLPAYILSRFFRVPYVFQVQDMWPETLRATGMLSSKRLLSIIGSFAKFVYSKAAKVCVISEGFKENLLQKNVAPSKIKVISNWIDISEYSAVSPDPKLAHEMGFEGKFNILYAGNIGEAQGLDNIIEAAKYLQDLSDIRFVFLGDGVARESLSKKTMELNLSNVVFLGRFPSKQMPDFFAISELLIVHLKKDPLFTITIPHKVFPYMACSKPILAVTEGDTTKLIEETNSGITCPPGDPEALSNAVRTAYSMSEDKLREMGTNGRHAVETMFSRDIIVKQIESVLIDSLYTKNSYNSGNVQKSNVKKFSLEKQTTLKKD